MVGGEYVGLDEIARIELQGDVPLPPRVRDGAVILIDGTAAKGRFVSLSLGVIDTTEGEIERDQVAWIVLAAPAARRR